MLLCPIYCSAIAFNPANLQRHVGKAMVCKLAHFPPTMDLFLAAGWQDRGHIHVLVCIPHTLLLWQQGWIYHSRSFLSGWWTRWSRFPTVHLVALLTAGHCQSHTALLQLPHLFQPPFFPAVCLQRWIYIHIPCMHDLAFCVLNPALSGRNGNK